MFTHFRSQARGSESQCSSRGEEPPSRRSASVEADALFTKPFVLMLCVQFLFGLTYSTFLLLPKYLKAEFHASASVIGAVASVGLLAAVALTPWIGRVIDSGVRRPSITYGAVVNGLSGGAFAWLHTVGAPLYLLRMVNGVSYALVFNAVVTLAADLAPPKKLGQAIGLCGAAGMSANAVAPAIAEVVAERHGWPLVFLLAGAMALIAALLSFGIREPRVQARAIDLTAQESPSAWSLLRDPGRFGVFLCAAANGAGFGVMFTFTQPFAMSLGASKVGAFFVGYTLCALSVRLFLGGLADKLGRHRVAFGAIVLYGLVTCLTSALRPELLLAVGACLGLAHGLLYPAINALAVEGAPRGRRGALMSYFSAAFFGGFALWVLAAGALEGAVGYPLAFLLTGLLVWGSLPFLPKRERVLGT